ncbi:MAG: flagellar hook-length control protein FliK [Caulobacteraceae bacterium]
MTAAAAIIATLLPQGTATPGQPAGADSMDGGFAGVLASVTGQATPAPQAQMAAPQGLHLATNDNSALTATLLSDDTSEGASGDPAETLVSLLASVAGAAAAPIAATPMTTTAPPEEAAPASGATTGATPKSNAMIASATLLQAALSSEQDLPQAAEAPAAAAPKAAAPDAQAQAPAPQTPPAQAAVPAAVSAQINALLNQAQAEAPATAPAPASAKTEAKTAKIETNSAVTRLTATLVAPDQASSDVETAEAVTAIRPQPADDTASELTSGEDKPAPVPIEPQADAPAAPTMAAPAAPILATLGQNLIKATAQTVSHFVDQVAAKFGAKSTEFQIALTPEGLGQVDVKLKITPDGALSAALSFDTPQAAAELRARASELQAALTQAGFDISDNAISFDVAGQNQGGGNGAAQADYLESLRERANRAVSDLADEAGAALASPPYSSPASGQGVDIRI